MIHPAAVAAAAAAAARTRSRFKQCSSSTAATVEMQRLSCRRRRRRLACCPTAPAAEFEEARTHYVLLLWSIIDAIQGLWSQNGRYCDFMVVETIKRAYFSSGKRLDLQIGL